MTEQDIQAQADEQTATKPAPELNKLQQQLISALVEEPEIKAASRIAGVGRTTAHRWLKEPAFRNELARQRDVVMVTALDALKTHATRAVTAMADLLSTEDERLRRQICNDILGHAIRIRELEDIERRLAALEKAAQKQEQRKR